MFSGFFHELHVTVGVFAAQVEVAVCHGKLQAGIMKQGSSDGGIRAAADCHQVALLHGVSACQRD